MRKKKLFFMVMGIFLGIAITSTISYVIAQTLINSKDVIYQDNSNLAADNVQDAIDGTCTKIDTRLSTIEDKLYTIKSYSGLGGVNATTDLSDTGILLQIPANSYCSITVSTNYNADCPKAIKITDDSGGDYNGANYAATVLPDCSGALSVTYSSSYIEKDTILKIYTSFFSARGQSTLNYKGFCAVKYK